MPIRVQCQNWVALPLSTLLSFSTRDESSRLGSDVAFADTDQGTSVGGRYSGWRKVGAVAAGAGGLRAAEGRWQSGGEAGGRTAAGAAALLVEPLVTPQTVHAPMPGEPSYLLHPNGSYPEGYDVT